MAVVLGNQGPEQPIRSFVEVAIFPVESARLASCSSRDLPVTLPVTQTVATTLPWLLLRFAREKDVREPWSRLRSMGTWIAVFRD